MLPAAHRLTDSESFRHATRRGRRSSSRTLVTHVLAGAAGQDVTRVGFVVSKAVGNAVVRNRVRRRLRHLCASYVAAAVPGSVLVVRALPAAASASYADLGEDLARALGREPGRAGAST